MHGKALVGHEADDNEYTIVAINATPIAILMRFSTRLFMVTFTFDFAA
jgi:hypothetical protein